MVAGYLRQCHGLFAFILSFGGLFVMATAALAQSEPRSVSILEVNRILTDPSQTAAEAMRFAGVVTFVSRAGGDISISRTSTAGIFVETANDRVPVKPGDRVEVTATIGYRTSDALGDSSFLHADRVKVVGTADLPEPRGIWLAEALRGAASGQRVWVEGVVMQATVSNGVVQTTHLTDLSGWAVLNVHDWRSGTTTHGWWGAKLRVTCTNVGRGHTALRATSSDDIAVTSLGRTAVLTRRWPISRTSKPMAGGRIAFGCWRRCSGRKTTISFCAARMAWRSGAACWRLSRRPRRSRIPWNCWRRGWGRSSRAIAWSWSARRWGWSRRCR